MHGSFTSYFTRIQYGIFNYLGGCPLLHFIPDGMKHEGMPVIIFPLHERQVNVGQRYKFEAIMTKEATFVLYNITYRVAHAVKYTEIDASAEIAVEEASPMDPVLLRLTEKDGWRIKEDLGDTVILCKNKKNKIGKDTEVTMIHHRPKKK